MTPYDRLRDLSLELLAPAVGMGSLPGNITVEIEAILDIVS